MSTDFTNEFDNAKVEAGKFDSDDILSFGINYFYCGYIPKDKVDGCYYNHSIAVAFAIIGKLYCPEQKGVSNYHKGIAYIAEKADLTSKRQIKVLRKKFSYCGGYAFKTPYSICKILSVMIELLSAREAEPILVEYLKQRESDMYREILIAKQYAAIMASAQHDTKVQDVYGDLRDLVKVVGE